MTSRARRYCVGDKRKRAETFRDPSPMIISNVSLLPPGTGMVSPRFFAIAMKVFAIIKASEVMVGVD
jgi:hypothetical protein